MLFKFEDREVEFPNRVKLTPVEGQPNTYTVERAEGTITNPGTPLTAANLMKLQQYSNIAAYALEAEKASGYTRGGEIDTNFKKSRMITRKRIDFSDGSDSMIYSAEPSMPPPAVSIVEFLPEGKTVEDIVGMGGTLKIFGLSDAFPSIPFTTVYFSTMWNKKESQETPDESDTSPELFKSDQVSGIVGVAGDHSNEALDSFYNVDLCYMTLGISKRGKVFMEGTPVGARLGLKTPRIESIPMNSIYINHLELYF